MFSIDYCNLIPDPKIPHAVVDSNVFEKRFLHVNSWFSRDVTKILKSKLGGQQNFYLLLRKDYLKIYLFPIP